MVVFAQHNITMHPPFTKIDFVSCRNLLIYMDAELQNKILGVFYMGLNNHGIMLLGSSETPGKQSHLFATVDSKLKIYKRANTAVVPDLFDFPSSFSRTKPAMIEKQMPEKPIPNIQMLTDQLLLQNFAPAGVLVNDSGDIIYISGRTGKYLEPAVGKANLNIFAMLREGLRHEFPVAFRQALNKKDLVTLKNLKVGTNGTAQHVNMRIQYVEKPEPLKGMVMIIFQDVAAIPEIISGDKNENTTLSSDRQKELEEELMNTREEIQNTLEEMQTSQEELKSTNEELQSTNEELQSTNEELTSSKEEMQSLNEELQTVNAELQSKVDDYSRVNNDMKNLLNSTDIATLFLDKDLNIRRYTNQATKLFKFIKSDIGRPFTDQVSDLIYPELAEDAIEVLRALISIQKPIPTKDGRWFSIRIMPYRTFDDRIDGLVITFINISDHKQLEGELHDTNQVQSLLLNSSTDVIIRLSTDWKIQEFNTKAERFFDRKRKDVINQNYIETLIPAPNRKQVEKELVKLLNEMNEVKISMEVIAAGAKLSVVEWSANLLLNNLKMPSGLIIRTKNTLSHE
jgi:two-component system CheB/CheR fusion protein